MQWNDHSRDIPAGAHALFGASNYAWLKYDPEKAIRFYNAILARKKGVELHDTARRCIDNGLQLKGRNYLSKYVNDAIGYRMRTEQPLKFTNNFFGTSDAIIFDEKNSLLRIHDLKTGETPAKLDQLLIYDALFCLEYHINPMDIEHELRIYQINNDILADNPDGSQVAEVMDHMRTLDNAIEDYKEGLM